MMKLIKEISQSLKDTERLKKKYYTQTSLVGVGGVGLGCLFMLLSAEVLATLLKIDLDDNLKAQEHGTLWFILFIIFIPLTFYLGVIIVAGSFGAVMYVLGRFTRDEVIEYALYSKYPQHWLIPENQGDTDEDYSP